MRQVASAMPEVAPRTRIFLVILAVAFDAGDKSVGGGARLLIGGLYLR
jgi:hypothetical protein